jgi:hypothetical protein
MRRSSQSYPSFSVQQPLTAYDADAAAEKHYYGSMYSIDADTAAVQHYMQHCTVSISATFLLKRHFIS